MRGPGREGGVRRRATLLLTSLLVLLVLLSALLAAPLAPPAGAARVAGAAEGVARASTPLRIQLDDIEPASLPRRGTMRVSGSVTNVDDRTWSAINLYVFLGDDPIDDPAELATAALAGEEVAVGDRITEAGTEARVQALQPGESTPFTLEVPARLLLERVQRRTGAAEPGVYWFGVHALGATDEGRDQLTDARARTFLPLLPSEVERAVPTSLVVPLRRAVEHEADGSLADVGGWAEDLALGGWLRDLVEFGATSGAEPVSWLVDPAVLDAVEQLARGNPGRLPPPAGADQPGGGASSGGPSGDGPDPSDTDDTDDTDDADDAAPGSPDAGTPSSGASGSPRLVVDPGSLSPEETEAAERATVLLDRFAAVSAADELLALPYGDVDVAGALAHDVRTYQAARRRQGARLQALARRERTTLVPVVAPPSGYLDPGTPGELAALDDGSVLLGSDRMVDGPAPSVVRVDGRPVVLASSGAAAGGPGPTQPLGTLALRQRVLAEATVRLVADAGAGPDALVVVLPPGFRPVSGSTFFEGLSSPAIALTDLAAGGSPLSVDVGADDLAYPDRAGRAALGAALFEAVGALRGAGRTLEDLLVDDDQVAGRVDAEALSGASYAARRDRAASRASLRASRAWIRERLGGVQVEAPSGVTLSGATGSFAATVVNTLDEAVTVQVRAVGDDGITLSSPDPVDIAPGARSSVEMQARDVSPGVHNVTLRLVDGQGRVLPDADVVPIRSAQVSNVIWLLLGSGAGLLLLTVALRAVRRVRRSRAAG